MQSTTLSASILAAFAPSSLCESHNKISPVDERTGSPVAAESSKIPAISNRLSSQHNRLFTDGYCHFRIMDQNKTRAEEQKINAIIT